MKKYSIFDIATYFLKRCDRLSGSSITLLKLQKLLYYAQGYYLAYNNKELFKDEFYIDEHGPYNKDIYEKYKCYGSESIPYNNDCIIEGEILLDFLNDVWLTFGIYDAFYLEEQTLKERPIKEAKDNNNHISKKSIKNFFQNIISTVDIYA